MTTSTYIQKNMQAEKTTPEPVPNWQNILFVVVTLTIFGVGVWTRLHALGLPFDRDGYDEGVYWQSLRAMSEGDTLYRQIFYSQPPFFLLSVFPVFMLFGQTIWAARLGIALVSLTGLAGAFMLGKALSGRIGAIVALLLLVMSPLYLRESQTLQAEAPSTAFSLLAVGLIYLWWNRPDDAGGLYLAILSSVALALGIFSKLLAISTVVPVGLLMITRLWQMRHNVPEIRFRSMYLLIVVITVFIITIAFLILPFANSFQQFWQSVVTFHTTAGSTFKATLFGNLAMLANKQLLITLLVAFYGTVVALLRRDRRVLPLVAWLVVTVFILLRQVPLFPHHLVALVPPLIGLASLGFGPVSNLLLGKKMILGSRIALISLSLLLITTVLSGYEILYYYHTQQQLNNTVTQQQNRVVKDLETLTLPDQLIITDAQFIAALANRNTPPLLVDTSTVRIRTGYVTLQQLIQDAQQQQVHSVLFYTGRLEPLVLGFHIWVSQHFHLAKSYGSGKELWIKI